MFPLPKGRGDVRGLSCMDPFDDLILRVLVGRIIAVLGRLLGDSNVYSYPVVGRGPAWEYEDHRVAARARRERGRQLLARSACAGMGTFDVENYYPSVDLDVLGGQLLDAPAAAVEALIEALHSLRELGGTTGLPIGFEGSAVLGNAYLLPADRVLADRREGLIRWTDDSWLFLRDHNDWDRAVPEYSSRLSDLGLRLNESKTFFFEKFWGVAEEIISHGVIDSITAAADGRVDPQLAMELLEAELDFDAEAFGGPDHKLINFTLSCLRSSTTGEVPRLVMAHPELWGLAPKVTGDVLAAAASDPIARRQIDVDWLVDVASTAGDATQAAGRLHAARVAAKLHLGKPAGERLFDIATNRDVRNPIRSMAAVAWASSEHWKPARAVEAALDAGHLTLRRAFVGGFKHRADHRDKQRHWRRLEVEDRDLVPTLAWAEA